MKFFIHTTGCKANQWDSGIIAGRLAEQGFTPSAMAAADIIVVNGCTVTAGAVRDIRRFFNGARRLNPAAALVLAGCHGQVYPDDNFGAHLVLGHAEKFRIADFVGRRGIYAGKNESPVWEAGTDPMTAGGKTRHFLKIQDGCDKYCAYCIVPYARGVPRSRPLPEIRAVLAALAARGVQEAVLTGIEIGAYRDPETGLDLAGLLAELEESPTPPRLRISSLDPAAVDERFISAMARSAKLARSLHLPVQSGSDAVLARMGRRHTSGFIAERVKSILSAMDDAAIGFDVIAGFPGEGEEEFDETVRLIESLPVYYLHAFPFSPRPGTAAALFDGAVPEGVKKDRVRRLRALDRLKRDAFHATFLGRTAFIIPETKVYRSAFLRGYTDNYIPVYVPAGEGVANRLVEVTIKESRDGLVFGELAR